MSILDRLDARFDMGKDMGTSRYRTCPGCNTVMGHGHTARADDGRWWHTWCLLKVRLNRDPLLWEEHAYEKDNSYWCHPGQRENMQKRIDDGRTKKPKHWDCDLAVTQPRGG